MIAVLFVVTASRDTTMDCRLVKAAKVSIDQSISQWIIQVYFIECLIDL